MSCVRVCVLCMCVRARARVCVCACARVRRVCNGVCVCVCDGEGGKGGRGGGVENTRKTNQTFANFIFFTIRKSQYIISESVSYLILTACQPHRVTSGRSVHPRTIRSPQDDQVTLGRSEANAHFQTLMIHVCTRS